MQHSNAATLFRRRYIAAAAVLRQHAVPSYITCVVR